MSYDGPVRRSPELERVLALPRRVLDFDSPEVLALAWSWSPMLLNEAGKREWDRIVALPDAQRDAEFARFARKKDEIVDGRPGENCPLLLNPSQAIMLYEAFHQKGLFASAGVGAGKTLVSYLLALILGAAVPLLIVPGSIADKTHEEFADLSRYWQAPRPLPQVITYEKLSNPGAALLLCDCAKCAGAGVEPATPGGIRPTHVFADESDRFRDPSAACTRRMGRFMSRHPATFYAGMTGTAWRKSIKNSAPQLIWALKWGAPVPLSYVDMQEWSEALDLSSRNAPRDPGALAWLAGIDPKSVPTYSERLEIAADAFKARLLETPGVVQTRGQSCDQPLHIRLLKAPEDPTLDAAFHHFRATQTTLDGWAVADPLSAMKHANEMACGFYYFWQPRPPKAWLEARTAAARFVAEKIAASGRRGRPLDSQAPVYREFPNEPVLLAWKAMEPTFIPNTVARPITASVLGYAVSWIKTNGPALIWVQHDYVGTALSAMSGVPYFGSKGKDSSGRYIGKHSPKLSAIVSLKANSRGRNLQGWHKNLVVGPPQAATDWEQGICGRTHRQGQTRPVHIDVIISCAENLRAVEKAYAEAEWVRSRGGATGRLLIAQYDWSHFPAAQLDALPEDHPSRARWVRPG